MLQTNSLYWCSIIHGKASETSETTLGRSQILLDRQGRSLSRITPLTTPVRYSQQGALTRKLVGGLCSATILDVRLSECTALSLAGGSEAEGSMRSITIPSLPR